MEKYILAQGLAQDWATLGKENPEAIQYWYYLHKKKALNEQEATTVFENLVFYSLWLAGYIIPHEHFINKKEKKEQFSPDMALRDFYATQKLPSVKDILIQLSIDIYALMKNSHKPIIQRFNETMVLLHYFTITGILQSLTRQINDTELANYIAKELVNKELMQLVEHIEHQLAIKKKKITPQYIKKLRKIIHYDFSFPLWAETAKIVFATAYTQAWSILRRWKDLAKILPDENIYYHYALAPIDSFDALYLFSYPMHYWGTSIEIPLAPTHLPTLWYTFFIEELNYKELNNA